MIAVLEEAGVGACQDLAMGPEPSNILDSGSSSALPRPNS